MSFHTQSSSVDLVTFYQGTTRDARGRLLSDILRWSPNQLEQSHDYIQTVFPLPETSGVNWDAPVVDKRVFVTFRSSDELKKKLRESFKRIAWFYGFVLESKDGEVKVVRGENYLKHKDNWDARFDHNHLRITRILRCLRVLGLEKEAKAFYEALMENQERVSDRSREYWRRAAERALNLRPDLEGVDEDDVEQGKDFLREFEIERRRKTGSVAGAGDEGKASAKEGESAEEKGGDEAILDGKNTILPGGEDQRETKSSEARTMSATANEIANQTAAIEDKLVGVDNDHGNHAREKESTGTKRLS